MYLKEGLSTVIWISIYITDEMFILEHIPILKYFSICQYRFKILPLLFCASQTKTELLIFINSFIIPFFYFNHYK